MFIWLPVIFYCHDLRSFCSVPWRSSDFWYSSCHDFRLSNFRWKISRKEICPFHRKTTFSIGIYWYVLDMHGQRRRDTINGNLRNSVSALAYFSSTFFHAFNFFWRLQLFSRLQPFFTTSTVFHDFNFFFTTSTFRRDLNILARL